jgi:hypothetical protein
VRKGVCKEKKGSNIEACVGEKGGENPMPVKLTPRAALKRSCKDVDNANQNTEPTKQQQQPKMDTSMTHQKERDKGCSTNSIRMGENVGFHLLLLFSPPYIPPK